MKVKLFISTGFASCNHIDFIDVQESELDGKNENEIEQYLQNLAIDFMHEKIDCSYEVIED